jgi:hypothetical protein
MPLHPLKQTLCQNIIFYKTVAYGDMPCTNHSAAIKPASRLLQAVKKCLQCSNSLGRATGGNTYAENCLSLACPLERLRFKYSHHVRQAELIFLDQV